MYILNINDGELICHIQDFTEGLELRELADGSENKETTAVLEIITYISAEDGEGNNFDTISLVDFLPYFRKENSINTILITTEDKKIAFKSSKYTFISNAKGDYDNEAENKNYYISLSFCTNSNF